MLRAFTPVLLRRYLAASAVAISVAVVAAPPPLGAEASERGGGAVEVMGEQIASDRVAAQEFLRLTNRDRAAAGLTPYVFSDELSADAATYATKLVHTRLIHAPTLAQGLRGSVAKIGENLGRGPDVEAIHAALMRSPKHRANLLDDTFTEMGIGVIRTDTSMTIVQRFRAYDN